MTQKKKRGVGKILSTLVVSGLIIGAGVFVYNNFLNEKIHKLKGGVAGHGYVAQKLNVGGKAISVNFDKSAKVTSSSANQTIMSGNDLVGKKVFVQIGKINAPKVPVSCDSVFEANASTNLDQVRILNTSYPLCGYNGDSSNNYTKNESIGAIFQDAGQWYLLYVNRTTSNLKQPVDINTAKKITQSISN